MTDDETAKPTVASWEQSPGTRPHPDPDEWERTWVVTTGHPCPTCGIALCLALGSSDMEALAREIMEDHPVTVPNGFTDGYTEPVYVYCDSPLCDYQGVVEWDDLDPHFDAWMYDSAPAWSDVSDGGRR